MALKAFALLKLLIFVTFSLEFEIRQEALVAPMAQMINEELSSLDDRDLIDFMDYDTFSNESYMKVGGHSWNSETNRINEDSSENDDYIDDFPTEIDSHNNIRFEDDFIYESNINTILQISISQDIPSKDNNIFLFISLLQKYLRTLHSSLFFLDKEHVLINELVSRDENAFLKERLDVECEKASSLNYKINPDDFLELTHLLDNKFIFFVYKDNLNYNPTEELNQGLSLLVKTLVENTYTNKELPFATTENNNDQTLSRIFFQSIQILQIISTRSLIVESSDNDRIIDSIQVQNPESAIAAEFREAYDRLELLIQSIEESPSSLIQVLLTQEKLLQLSFTYLSRFNSNTDLQFCTQAFQDPDLPQLKEPFPTESTSIIQEAVEVSSILLETSSAQQEASQIEDLRISYSDEEGNIFINSADIQREINEWGDLIDALDDTEKVAIGENIISISEAESEVKALEGALKTLSETGTVLIISNGEASLQEPVIEHSEQLSSEAFETFTEASLNFQESIPIISTTESSEEILTRDGTLAVLVTPEETFTEASVESIDSTPQDTNSVNPNLMRDEIFSPLTETLIIDNPYESTSYILLTTYISGQIGTGKIWVMPADKPSNIYLLLEGFQVPTSVCFDTIHMFLYIVDHGHAKDHGSIFQYQMEFDDGLDLKNDIYVEVYSGTPGDCKVDSYGNLYFIDSLHNNINIISYPDLYSGFKNRFLTIYSATRERKDLRSPIRFDLGDKQELYYVNSVAGSGTLHQAAIEVEGLNEEPIISIAHENSPAWGVTFGNNMAYYSLDNGDIKAYNTLDQSIQTISSDFFLDPKGMCYANDKIYIADHGKGAIYTIDKSTQQPVLIAHVQAVEGIFCLNSAVSLLSVVIFMILSC